ncbi:glyoxalase [Burkholderia stagnalis]|nr:glyoxalase [Burkholderia stagnalis]KVN05756.1 glyoxalase [Burkholderia stagnalis]KVN25336.1 glyoxalase [Burkholderia stagnalis]KVN67628.1 glyoxalase [Burkholderia stagnalis]KWD97128.1 glyoxalase [Burkholderia stagnalis]
MNRSTSPETHLSSLASTINALRPFVPSRDFDTSKRFYLELGFTLAYDGEGIAELLFGRHSILLQDFYEPAHANNTMLQMVVGDLDAWWRHIDSLWLTERYALNAPIAPAMQPWGRRVAFLFDPSGVLWHISEAAPAAS